MSVHVAVIDPLPMYQQGVAAVLAADGHTVETPADVVSWVRRRQLAVVILTLDSEYAWDLLNRLVEQPSDHRIIALLAEESATLGVRAIRAGARSVVARQVTVPVLRRTVEATIDGQSVLPAVVASALAFEDGSAAATSRPLSPQQVTWLRQLAAGSTVAQLADQVGYSERAMFRLLQALYQQLGARNRVQALLQAQQLGWLSGNPDS